MTPREITAIALKFFAVYIAFHLLSFLPSFVNTLAFHAEYASAVDSSHKPLLLFGIGGGSLVLLTVAYLVWKLASGIADGAAAMPDRADDQRIGESFLLSLLGIYLIVTGTQALVFALANTYMTWEYQEEQRIVTLADAGGSALQLAIGLSLVLQARGWSALLRRLRTTGRVGP